MELKPKELEKLKLSKNQVLAIIQRRIDEWKMNWKENKVYIFEGMAIKLLIKAAPEAKFGYFWETLIQDIDSVRYENARKELPETFSKISNSSSSYALDVKEIMKA